MIDLEQLLGRTLDPLALFGFAAQFLFMSRFLLQIYVSEKQKRSTVPVGFWWISLAGGLSLLIYASLRLDPVFMLGQTLGLGIYSRNLFLIYTRKARIESRRAARRASPAHATPVPATFLDDSLTPLDPDDTAPHEPPKPDDHHEKNG
jgi:lipid-A-disaccharide synthase-like uncharacterized protein